MSNLTEALELIAWFDECDGFRQGTDAPHKWVLQADSELRRLSEQVEKLTMERDELKTVPMKYRRMQFNTEIQDEVTQLQKQLAALAEQNAKMRKALTKWRYLDSSYNWRCGHCGNEVEDGHKEDCALSLPNLATPALNRIKAEAYLEAAEEVARLQAELDGLSGTLLSILNCETD